MKKKYLKEIIKLQDKEIFDNKEEISKLLNIIVAKKISIPFTKETKEALDAIGFASGGFLSDNLFSEKKSTIPTWDISDSYESGTAVMFYGAKLYAFKDGIAPTRFMPGVKFKFAPIAYKIPLLAPVLGYSTDAVGDPLASYANIESYKECLLREVNIYEAMPELIPEDMVYDRDSDSLVKKDSLEKFVKGQRLAEDTMEELDNCLKFIVPPELLGKALKNGVVLNNENGYFIRSWNETGYFLTKKGYLNSSWNEVSIYEAILELIPEDMVHDKDSDSLVGNSK